MGRYSGVGPVSPTPPPLALVSLVAITPLYCRYDASSSAEEAELGSEKCPSTDGTAGYPTVTWGHGSHVSSRGGGVPERGARLARGEPARRVGIRQRRDRRRAGQFWVGMDEK